MKSLIATGAGVVAVLGTCGLAHADVYSDSEGDIFDTGFTHLDIMSVTLTNDADWLYISVQTGGDLDATNWGKYGIGIDNGKTTGDNSNGWGRNVDWGRNITHWAATWADDGGSGAGGEVYEYAAGWNLLDATYSGNTLINADDSGHAGGVQSWRIALSALDITVGDTIYFDVISTGGTAGDPGVDHLSYSDLATTFWDVQSVAGDFLTYTVVPAPASMALLGMAGLIARRRR